jgi:rhodanese-related sulfurtransferase
MLPQWRGGRKGGAVQRLEPEWVYERMQRGEVYLIDVRGDRAYWMNTDHIPGDVHDSPLDVERQWHRIPRDRQIVAYSSWPGEATAAKVARFLERQGYKAGVLRGGLEAWKAAGYPTEPLAISEAHVS